MMEKKTYILPYFQLQLYHLHVALGMAREIRFLITVVVWYHICNICSTPHLHINVLAFFSSCSLLCLMLRALYLFGRVRSFRFFSHFFSLDLAFFFCLVFLVLCLKSKVGYFENVHAHKFICF